MDDDSLRTGNSDPQPAAAAGSSASAPSADASPSDPDSVIARLMAVFTTRLTALCLYYRLHHDEAEDVLAELWARILKYLRDGNVIRAEEKLLPRATRHLISNYYKKWKNRPAGMSLDQLAELPDRHTEHEQRQRDWRELVYQLPFRERQAVLGRLQGMTQDEIAADMDVNTREVRRIMRRAERWLRARAERQ